MTAPLLTPDTGVYQQCLAALNNGTAAAENPALIAQPRQESEVIEAIQLAADRNLSISVCSGSHSAHCATSGTLMLDLSHAMNRIEPRGDRVWLQGGAAMGRLVQTLAPHGRMVPVGTHATPGFGLLTMGGVGHLSRSLGLTVDFIEELRGVTSTGERVSLNADVDDQELWRLMRGGAIFLAVITEATLRTAPRQPLLLVRCLHPLTQLAALLEQAEALPREAASSMILGVPPDGSEPQVLTYVVATKAEALGEFAQGPRSWTEQAAGLEHLAPFELPLVDGSVPALPTPSGPRRRRVRTWVYSISVCRDQVAALTVTLQRAMATAPNQDCRIDLQHVGGVDGDVPLEATAYRGRHAEWSVVITAVWSPLEEAMGEAARAWADACFDALVPLANHYYVVQRHPGTSRYLKELELAYGPALDGLRHRKRQLDPQGLLPTLV